MQYGFGETTRCCGGEQPPEMVQNRCFPEIATSALGPPRNDSAGTAVQTIRPVIARAAESEASARGNLREVSFRTISVGSANRFPEIAVSAA